MKLLIVVYHRFDLWNAPVWFAKRLRKDFPRIEIVHLTSYEGVEEQLWDSEIVFTISLRAEQFAVAREVRWIHVPAAAVHQLLIPEVVNSDVVVTNAREVHGPVVAEHVIALVFALAKKIPQAVRLQQRHVWGQELIWNDSPKPRELAAATLGLIGLGSIGREVARRASALGMRVIAVREHAEKGKSPGVDEVFSSALLDRMLAQSDYVVLAAPLTPATRGLMNATHFAAMKADAYLINVGRGPLIDDAALVGALRERRIGGAALDVFENEPIIHPGLRRPNVVLAPHIASASVETRTKMACMAAQNVVAMFTGQQPANILNPEVLKAK